MSYSSFNISSAKLSEDLYTSTTPGEVRSAAQLWLLNFLVLHPSQPTALGVLAQLSDA